MIVFLFGIATIFIAINVFIHQPPFGAFAKDERLERLKKSPNYRHTGFQNQHFTPTLAEGTNHLSVLKDFFFGKSKLNRPDKILPSQKTNLHTLPADENVLVWFGHSSYFMQVDRKKILVDPVFSGNASPFSFTTKSYPGADVYTPEDIPEIDYLFISHDHWDHLDYRTIITLRPKIKKIITGLGTAAHLERWGFDTAIIIENDWNEKTELGNGFVVTTLPARHFSGRTFKRNQALWLSFALTTPTMRIFLGGDSGYDTHFAEIGKTFGPFDLAILECGQYNPYWKYIHMMPEETIQAAIDLQAKKVLPVHWAKFSLALHAWDEPIIRVTKEGKKKNFPVLHPMIGQKMYLSGGINNFINWWDVNLFL